MALFAGDAHLRDDQPEGWETFFDFLRGPARSSQRLYLLGDLFEAWVGDDDRRPLGERMRRELRAVAEAGVAVCLIVGNHDFMIGEEFCAEAAVEFGGLRRLVVLAGRRLLLMHGDALDRRYRRRRIWANPAIRRLLAAKPLAERLQLAAKYAADPVGGAAAPEIDERRAGRLIDSLNLDAIVHGHTHRPQLTDAGGKRAVIPAWPQAGGAGGWIELEESGRLKLCQAD